jgi:hypothetical protein
MHLDIVADDVEAEVRRLQEPGVRRLNEGVPVGSDVGRFCVSTGVEW